MNFELISNYKPTGDQPEAIKELIDGIRNKEKYQTLLGVTGSGKTFTIANVIEKINKPTLVLSHNKTLAAQLYSEFKSYFPNNLVEYFVSYYDYYQPEAFIPSTGVYIEKDLSINNEIEKLRLKTTSSLLSGREDIIVVASVSCIYGIGNPEEFHKQTIKIKVGNTIEIEVFLKKLVSSMYNRNMEDIERGQFRIKGETIDVFPAYGDSIFRISFWGEEIDEIEELCSESFEKINTHKTITIYPANNFLTSKNEIEIILKEIKKDLINRLSDLEQEGFKLEAKRLEERVNLDLEMIKELGYCSGIENYSRYFDRRKEGSRPFCLIDYFNKEFITIIDESHVSIPQIRAMFGGDKSRKLNLVEHGFRLPSALDNRPLKFEEWELLNNQTIFVSATPADYEIKKSEGNYIEQIIRPTGLIDPEIEVRPVENQIFDLIEEIKERIQRKERVLITTLTKRMAEELTKFLDEKKVKTRYIHSDVDTLERIEIIHGLRKGDYDVLVGVNLLREGLDLPEVSLVAILDADKEGFLRSHRSLTQTAGRAARNLHGKVIMYADKITKSMRLTIEETESRRKKQIEFNDINKIKPKPIIKNINTGINEKLNPYKIHEEKELLENNNLKNTKSTIKILKNQMENAAKNLDFDEAIKIRDRLFKIQKLIEKN